ncbi:MAG: alkaline phosphatase family protein [Deltaproteobacteria bacterium]|nr:alkaline phosphatase family protein [Deltaproteobacteria bacterium]
MGLLDRWRRGGPAKRRAALVGLDGVGLSLARTLVDAGVMPRLAAICRAGTMAPMTSTLPTISNVSWTSLVTGVNPGRHGIYGFTDLARDRYTTTFPNSGHVRAPAFWDALGAGGRASVVLNVPGTYPAKDIVGTLVSGFVAVSLERAVRPPAALAVLRAQGYRVDVDYVNADRRPEAFFDDLFATLAARRRVFRHFLAGEWDCFLGVVTETDRLHHYFWHAWTDRAHRWHQRFLDFYAEVDAAIGEVADAVGDATPLFVVADHGHTAIESECHPNVWLQREGLLRFASEPPRALADMDRGSRVFVLDPGRIYLHLRGRFAEGVVAPGAEADEVLARVVEGLRGLAYPEGAVGDGRRPVVAVRRRDELYSGPHVEDAPDAVIEPRAGFDFKGSIGRRALFDRSPLTGMHTYDDALFCVNRPDVPTDGLTVTDVAPTVLAWLGCPPLVPMDGRARVAV